MTTQVTLLLHSERHAMLGSTAHILGLPQQLLITQVTLISATQVIFASLSRSDLTEQMEQLQRLVPQVIHEQKELQPKRSAR